MPALHADQDSFFQTMREEFEKREDPSFLQKSGWRRFQEIGVPSHKVENYRYIRLHHFFSKQFTPAQSRLPTEEQIEPFIFPESKNSLLVFVDGVYSQELSNTSQLPKIVISSFDEALASYGTFLTNYWTKALREEKDGFAALNAATHREGMFIYVPPKTVCEAPLQLLHLSTQSNSTSTPRLFLLVGRLSQVEIANRSVQLHSEQHCQNSVVEISLEEGASVKSLYERSALANGSWYFNALRATLKQNSTLKVIDFTDSAAVRNDYHIVLAGENSNASLNGLCMLQEKKETHTHILMDHQAPHCHSNQLFKSVLAGYSRSSFEGKILVRQAAQKTEAYQLNSNLLLSDRANADSKPNLEIFADDVKASHGATVGQLDKEQLFYCQARGYSIDDARNLLIHGFCEEILDLISLPSVVDRLSKHSKRFLL